MTIDMAEYPVTMRIEVMWSDMDAYGHVNNSRYFKYFEMIRHRFYERTGLFRMKEETGVGPIMKKQSCEYIKPVSYPDTLTVGARVRTIGESHFVLEFAVVSDAVGPAAAGEGVIVTFDYGAGTKTPVPASFSEAARGLGNPA